MSQRLEAGIREELKQHGMTNGAAQNGKGEAEPKRKPPLFELMATVTEEEIDCVWRNRIPRGKSTLYVGDPGVGKSYTALAVAAALSNGEALPFDVEPEAPLRSWIISAEDGPAPIRSSRDSESSALTWK